MLPIKRVILLLLFESFLRAIIRSWFTRPPQLSTQAKGRRSHSSIQTNQFNAYLESLVASHPDADCSNDMDDFCEAFLDLKEAEAYLSMKDLEVLEFCISCLRAQENRLEEKAI